MTLGFDKQLYILPFDHRGTFQTEMVGWDGTLTAAQMAEIAAAKHLIYDGFKTTIEAGILGSTFWEPLVKSRAKKITREAASRRLATDIPRIR